jgi:ubiquinone/menaquinone biosynthesis C-methylase UbiE
LSRKLIAIDIDPEMIAQAGTRLGGTPCQFLVGDAYHLAEMVATPADLVFMANTFHGVPDKPRLARAVASTLTPGGRFIVVNWHARPRHETTVLGQPRGPKTELRLEPGDVQREVAPAGLLLSKIIELPPYHYGAIFGRSA